jgi:hypothetical protein
MHVKFMFIPFVLAYVGAATVMASCWWFMKSQSGPTINYWQLVCIIRI